MIICEHYEKILILTPNLAIVCARIPQIHLLHGRICQQLDKVVFAFERNVMYIGKP
jgi:hypothetical protein